MRQKLSYQVPENVNNWPMNKQAFAEEHVGGVAVAPVNLKLFA